MFISTKELDYIRKQLAAQAKEIKNLKLENKTNVEINLSEGSKDYSLKGKYILAVLEKLNQCTDDYEKEIVSLALKLGIQCFTDEEVTVDDN